MIDLFHFRFSYPVLFLFLSGCGVQPKNETNSKDVPILKSPNINMSASVPQEPVYLSSIKLDNLKNNFEINKESKDVIYSSGGKLFLATKNGGLGSDLDDDNKLISYQGIPIKIEKAELENDPNVEVSAMGVVGSANDESCSKIFSYDKILSIITINTKFITSLTICKVTIKASSIENNKVYSNSSDFEIVLNLTFSDYYKQKDKAAYYIKKYSGILSSDDDDSIKRISKFLKDSTNQDLNLNYDSKLISEEEKFTSFDSITAVQTLTSLRLENTNLNNLNAIMNLPNLVLLDISGTKVDPKDLKLLSRMKNLKKLYVRNLDIKDLTYITKYLHNLEELDISGNTKIEDLDSIKNLQKLKILRASNISLKSLKQLENLTQIISLDISNNDFSKINEQEYNILVNLYKLSELNISNSAFPDDMLNTYFNTISASRLKTFIDRNHFNRNSSASCKVNYFNKIGNFKNLINLEHIDLSGNACLNSAGMHTGISDTQLFVDMHKLNYLNISNTGISNLDGIKSLNIQELILNEADSNGFFSSEKAIMVTKNRCKEVLGQSQKACNFLSDGLEKLIEFRAPGSHSWKVPENITSVKVVGCSGANGGAGGGGGGSAGALFAGSWWRSSWGGSGGASGAINDSGAVGGSPGSGGRACQNESNCVNTDSGHINTWQNGGSGGSGGLGEISMFGSQNFSAPSRYVERNANISCIGGVSGSGGSGGTNISTSEQYGGSGGAGASPAEQFGWSSKIESHVVHVIPGQIIEIKVGNGGAGGLGGAGGSKQNGGYFSGSHSGSAGSSGTSGANGFIKIYYESL